MYKKAAHKMLVKLTTGLGKHSVHVPRSHRQHAPVIGHLFLCEYHFFATFGHPAQLLSNITQTCIITTF